MNNVEKMLELQLLLEQEDANLTAFGKETLEQLKAELGNFAIEEY